MRSIREACSKDYTPEQIAAWSGKALNQIHWMQTIERDLVWVVVDPMNEIFGYGQLNILGAVEGFQAEDNQSGAYVAGLYFLPEVHGLGLGRKMVELMFVECQRENVQVIQLHATKTAFDFYSKMGFSKVTETTVRIGGVPIECIEMIRPT